MRNLNEILQHLEQSRANEQLRRTKQAQHQVSMGRLATLDALVSISNDIREGR